MTSNGLQIVLVVVNKEERRKLTGRKRYLWEGRGVWEGCGEFGMNAGCAGKTEIPRERVPYLGALEVCSRQGAIQIHVYLYLWVWEGCGETEKYGRGGERSFENFLHHLDAVENT